jgi:Rrf2 family protein
MLSSTCRYGIRAVIYIASKDQNKGMTGIKQISKDLGLPSPFLSKILQQLAKQKVLNSAKGPHGGFSLVKDPKKITLFDIIKAIDGDEIFTDCVMHNGSCKSIERKKIPCTLHEDYDKVRGDMINLFQSRTIYDLVQKATGTGKSSI